MRRARNIALGVGLAAAWSASTLALALLFDADFDACEYVPGGAALACDLGQAAIALAWVVLGWPFVLLYERWSR